MSRLLSRSFAVFCVGLFLFGLATYSVSSFQQSQKNRAEPAQAFKLIELESDVDANGVETFKALRIHEVEANGDWRTVVHPIGKSGGVEYASTSEGLSAAKGNERIMLDEGKKRSLSPEQQEKMRTVGFYENHPDLVGTGMIAGLKVYKLRTPLDQKDGWLEMANSPKTGKIPLCVIVHQPDGAEHRIEAVKVEFK